MNIGKHFTLEELTVSETAARKGIDNTPNASVIASLTELATHILDPLREKLGVPVLVTSGYRSVELNKAIGGAGTSQHCKGEAADIHVNGMTIRELATAIRSFNLPYDQLIEEFGSWVHVSYSPRNLRQYLIATRVNGRAVYAPA